MTFELFDLLASPIFIFGADREVLYCNDACATLLEVPRQKFTSGVPCHSLVTFADPELFVMPNGDKGKDKATKYREVEFKSVYGKAGTVRIAVKPIPQADAKKLWICYLIDVGLETSLQKKYIQELEKKERFIAQLQATQEQLIQSSKMATIGEFTANISHELNNPLAVLLNCVEDLSSIVQAEPLNKEIAAKFIGMIERSTQKILKLSQHLKSFSHGPLTDIHLVPTAMSDVIESAMNFTQHLTTKRSIKVINNVPKNIPKIPMDPSLMEQVAVNMIKNAAEAILEANTDKQVEPVIEINGRYQKDREKLVVSFKDNGPGIPPETRKKLFTPFFTTKPIGKGTGLGLSICQSMAVKHGGSLSLDPSTGAGTTFFLTLPVTEMDGPPAGEAKADLVGKTILVVDDEPLIRDILNRYLSETGCKVIEAESGEQALERIAENPPDLVITDIIMHKMDGVELARNIRKTYPKTRISFVSGSLNLIGGKLDRVLYDSYLTKPFTKNGLQHAIHEAFHKN